jgi:hypothetical protein
MSDHDWDTWKTLWKEGGRPMPEIVTRARTDRQRAMMGMAMAYVIVAAELTSVVVMVRHARTLLDYGAPVVITSTCAFILVGMHAAMRGTWEAFGATPEALLGALERRHKGRLRLCRILPWATSYVVIGTLGLVVAESVARGHHSLLVALFTTAVCLGTVGFAVWVIRRTRRGVERDLREVAEARKLLAGDGADSD